jgi:hypothetical protein
LISSHRMTRRQLMEGASFSIAEGVGRGED